jgi:hypothetical protein
MALLAQVQLYSSGRVGSDRRIEILECMLAYSSLVAQEQLVKVLTKARASGSRCCSDKYVQLSEEYDLLQRVHFPRVRFRPIQCDECML